jgi:hypothetical protein
MLFCGKVRGVAQVVADVQRHPNIRLVWHWWSAFFLITASVERLSWRRGGKGYHPSYPVRRPGPESYSSPNRISALRGFAGSKGNVTKIPFGAK